MRCDIFNLIRSMHLFDIDSRLKYDMSEPDFPTHAHRTLRYQLIKVPWLRRRLFLSAVKLVNLFKEVWKEGRGIFKLFTEKNNKNNQTLRRKSYF